MSAVAFDTYEMIKTLTSGKGAVSKDTAEKIVSAMKMSHGELSTKADITLLQKDIRNEMESLESRMLTRMVELESRLTQKMLAGQLGTLLIMLGAFRFFGH
jgi:hypothetical protein